MPKEISNLLYFIDNSPTAFHATANIQSTLIENGFIFLNEKDKWKLRSGEKYYIQRNNSSVIAFQIGDEKIEEHGFRMIGSHLDSPAIKIKPNPEIFSEGNYLKLNTEVYGGAILSSWFDRPLSIAGKVILKNKNTLNPITQRVKLIDIKRPIGIIPSLAIHLSRNSKENEPINKQYELLPIVSLLNDYLEKDNLFLNLIKEELKIDEIQDILDFELFLYDSSKGETLGINNEFINSSRLDDLWMVHATMEGLLNSKGNKSTKVAVFLNNEEIGSQTQEGADSIYLSTILRRISIGLNKNEEDFYRALHNSVMISADLAHGVHPNFSTKYDITNRPVLGKGVAIKYSANKRYLTDANTSALIITLCEKNNIAYQKFVNESNTIGGSTMGVFFSGNLGIPVVDLGCGILSMHSIKELGATKDIKACNDLFRVFYEL